MKSRPCGRKHPVSDMSATRHRRSRHWLTRKLKISIESLNYQLRKVTKARGHFPGDDAVVKLLWLAIINIEDKRARERAARRNQTGKRHDQPARLIEGQRVMGWREALNELDLAYPRRLR
jgi:putative transposase